MGKLRQKVYLYCKIYQREECGYISSEKRSQSDDEDSNKDNPNESSACETISKEWCYVFFNLEYKKADS